MSRAGTPDLSHVPVAHVRRGDYATSMEVQRTTGLLTRDYYEAAFGKLGVAMSDAVFFTDDADAVREEFGVSRAQVIGSSDGYSDLESLLLMSSAHKLVIPNSTFSWWAATLAEPSAQVAAPSRWFADGRAQVGLAREDWLRVDPA